MKANLVNDKEYRIWLADIKARVRTAQIKAAVKVNTELLNLYWGLGMDIVEKQKMSKWGNCNQPTTCWPITETSYFANHPKQSQRIT